MALRIAIIGGSGFIGTVLARKLTERGHLVSIFDLNKSPLTDIPLAQGDVRDLDVVKAAVAGCDVIYNLAAAHHDNIRPLSLYEEVNVDGARNVCVAASAAGIGKIIFTSSVAVYGDSPTELTEDSAHRHTNEYGRTKSLAENQYKAWFDERPGRTLTMVRPTVVFGPGNRGNVYNLVSQMASGRFLMVGAGTNRKSMAYVENVAEFLAYVLALEGGPHIYNYADKPDFSMNELVGFVRSELGKGNGTGLRLPAGAAAILGAAADTASRILGRQLPVSSVRIQKFQANTQIAAEKLRTTGFIPAVGLRDGLQRMIRAEFEPRRG